MASKEQDTEVASKNLNQETGFGHLIADMLWKQQILTTIGDNMSSNTLIGLLAGLTMHIREYCHANLEKGPDGQLRKKQ